jgi:poly(A) polymerase
LFQDKDSLEIIEIIFPQLKNLAKFKKLNTYARDNLFKIDFIFLLALMIVDGTDNTDYFLYKFNISKKDQKRLKLIDFFYKEKTNLKNFTEKNFNKIFYFNGKQAVIDIINFKLFTSNKVEKKTDKINRSLQR